MVSSLSFNYDLKYKTLGNKQASFTFEKQNKITKLELLKIKVKRLSSSDQNIKYPKDNFITIPFKLYNNLIGVETYVDGEKQIFILDTGSPKLILNAKYFIDKEEKGARTLSPTNTKGVNGTISNLNIYKAKELNFYGIKYSNQNFITMDLSHLESSLNIKISGLIGYETIKNFDILFDYKNKQIVLIKPEYFKQYKQEYLKTKLCKIPIEMEKDIAIVKAVINNKTYSFGIDCGAEVNLVDHKLFNELENNLRKIKTDTLIGADKNRQEAISARLKKLIIRNERYRNMRTMFSDISHLSKGCEIKLNGLLGYEFLSKRKIPISFKREELIFIR